MKIIISRFQTNGTSQKLMHYKDNSIATMWGMPVNTDRTITVNRPDIIVKDSGTATVCKLIHMSIPSDRNIASKEIEEEKQIQRPKARNRECGR